MNASGNGLVQFDPMMGYANGGDALTVYTAVGFADGTVSSPYNLIPNPFTATSGKPVSGFAYRVVSALLEVIPMNPITS